MSKHKPRDDFFEQALRAGPPRVEPSIGFRQRMENGWRHAPLEEASDWASWWRALLSDLTAPAVALGALALVVVFFHAGPRAEPRMPSQVAVQPVSFDAQSAFGGGSLATLRTSLEGGYAEESRLMMEDTARALRFAASQLLPPEVLARAEDRGWITSDRRRDG